MFWLIGTGFLVAAGGVVAAWWSWDSSPRAVESIAFGVFASLVLLLLFLPATWLCRVTWGSLPTYDVGQRVGYVTKLSRRGLVWKTWEAELQSGVGELAALQAPWTVSVPDFSVRLLMTPFVGSKSRVRILYHGWFLQPYRRGESGREAVGFEVVE